MSTATRQRGILLLIRDVVIIVFVALLISFIVKTFLVRTFYVPSGSMENTLQVDDRILVNQLVPDVVPLERGDVVVFEDPGGWLPASPPADPTPLEAVLGFIGLVPQDADNHLVKRVIGLPGDTIECCDAEGRILVNGVAIDEPYVTLAEGEVGAASLDFSVTVPAGSMWVMGDNRHHSRDSSLHIEDAGGGFVPLSRVVGRAFAISWPVDHWTWLDNHPEVFAGVD